MDQITEKLEEDIDINCPIFVNSKHIVCGSMDIQEFNNELEVYKKEYLEKIKTENPHHITECKYAFVIGTDYDSEDIAINIYRSRDKEEELKEQERLAKIKKDKDYKEAQKLVLEDDPEYKTYLLLRERFKHIS